MNREKHIHVRGGSTSKGEVLGTDTLQLCSTPEDYPGLNASRRQGFGFNGMEKDNKMKGNGNSLDFGARIYDSRLGRFLSLDPLAINYPSESNYMFAGNSPIYMIDVDGKYKYPKGQEGKDYANTYPMLTLYLSKYLENDIMESQVLRESIVEYSKVENFTQDNLRQVIQWGDASTTEISFGECFGNAYTVGKHHVQIDAAYALEIEGILTDENSTQEVKDAAMTTFFLTMLDETTLVGNYWNGTRGPRDVIDLGPGYGEGEIDPGDQLREDLYYKRTVEENGRKVEYVDYDLSDSTKENNYKGSQEINKMKKDEGKKDMLPTNPAN